MKIPTLKEAKGFTLIEVLVVITIMGLLAAMAWAATGLVRTRQDRKKAETDISLMEASLQAYKADNGGLMPYANGDEWSSHILYRMLSGDVNNDGKVDQDKAGQRNTVYCSTLAINLNPNEESQVGIPVYRIKLESSPDMPKALRNSKTKRFAIIDPWGNPYRYRVGCEADTDNNEEGEGINADFDLFSVGPDGSGNSKTRTGTNQDNISNIKSLQN